MLNHLVHRGPDDGHLLSDEHIALGARRLSIIDVSGGRQPVTNENGTVWAVLNGEIYNAAQLRENLEALGHRFRSRVDTEVLVHLYEEQEEEFLGAMRGMFSLAIWDQKRRRLLLARDRIGIKPLYFHADTSGRLLFASEMKALLSCSSVSRKIDSASLNDFFSFKHVPAPRTIYADIRCLLPGERLIAEGEQIRRERYWKVRYRRVPGLTPEEAARGIRERLEEAVRSHMVSDVPVGAYLSGGVDSSSIVAFMSRFSSGPIKTFSLGYEDPFQNKEADVIHARRVARLFGTEHHEHLLSYREVLDELDEIVEAFDEPFGGVISTYFVTRLIGRHVKVALSGDGADELFGSYLSHRLAQPITYFRNHFGCRIPDRPLMPEERSALSPYADDLDYLAGLAAEKGWEWRFKLSVFNNQEKRALYSPMLQDEMSAVDSEETMRGWYEAGTTEDPLNQVLEVECNHILPDQVLAFVDRLSMAHSVEVRPPFLDHYLVEFAATIPGCMKIKDGRVKHILKEAMREVLPQEVIDRPKEGFVMPLHQWMAKELRPFLAEVLAPNRLRRHGFFHLDYVRCLLQASDYDLSHANKLWALVMFQLWYEKYIG